MKNNIKVKVNLKLDAYSIMETEFEGMPPRNEIKSRMRIILALYQLQETEQNLDIIGCFLISLKKQHGVPEMEILQHMSVNKVKGVTLKMQAVIAAVHLSKFKKNIQ